MNGEKKVLVIAGPTGCGESTVTKSIIEKHPIFTRLVAATTRDKRLKEQEGVDYYYFSKERFLDEIEKGNIIEHTYVENRDVYYGSYKVDLDKKIAEGKNIVVNVDVVGAKYFKENYNATTIFLKAESFESLERRLKGRDANISQEELDMRINNAKEEIENEEYFYDHVIINEENKLDQTIEKVSSILQDEGYILS